jgi:hypothetical protein
MTVREVREVLGRSRGFIRNLTAGSHQQLVERVVLLSLARFLLFLSLTCVSLDEFIPPFGIFWFVCSSEFPTAG